MAKKKLLITASTFPRWNGDTEPRFILDYAIAVSEYYDVTVLVPSAPGAKKRESMEGVEVLRYHYFPISKLETLCYPGAIVPRIKEKKARGLLVPFLFVAMFFKIAAIKNRYDYIHAHWIVPQGMVQGLFHNKFILTGHGGDVSSLNSGVIKKCKAKAIAKADHITVVSGDLKEMLMNHYSVSPDKIDVIPMGCDISKFSPSNRKENLWNQNGRKVILFVGRLVEKKGAEYLIKALEGLDAKLVIVGDGPEREKLEKMAELVDADIEFAGAKDRSELLEIFASCDIFCIPSVLASDGDKDGMPVVLIEAMASGAPVVGTKIGGIPEIIRDGENGYLVEQRDVEGLRNALRELLIDDQKRKMFSEASRKSAEAYDYKVIGEKFKQIIDQGIYGHDN